MKKILVVYGTRPEAVKLAPLINVLKDHEDFDVKTVLTGQHRDLVTAINNYFDIKADYDLDIMKKDQDLFDVTIRVLDKVRHVLSKEQPDAIIVQGDTSSAFASAQAAFYLKIPVYHVEAGLRTDNIYNPFPEEMNRRMISQLASLHFAPTAFSRNNLLKENIPSLDIIVTGNTVIDALFHILQSGNLPDKSDILNTVDPQKKLVLLTTHRRENDGRPRQNILEAVNELLETHPDIEVVFPAHPGPQVTSAIRDFLKPHPGLHVVPAQDYFGFLQLMNAAYLILTDSGGVQEEAPALGKPVLVLRETTERPEVIEAGNGILAGTAKETIVKATGKLLTDKTAYQKMTKVTNLYGEGNAAVKIVEAIQNRLLS